MFYSLGSNLNGLCERVISNVYFVVTRSQACLSIIPLDLEICLFLNGSKY